MNTSQNQLLNVDLMNALKDIFAGRSVSDIYNHTEGLDGSPNYIENHPNQRMITVEKKDWMTKFPNTSTQNFGNAHSSQNMWSERATNRFIVCYDVNGDPISIEGDCSWQHSFGQGTIISSSWKA